MIKQNFRKKRVSRTSTIFSLGEDQIDITDKYKYLGIYLNEYLDFNVTCETLAGAAGRALGGVISKFKQFKDVGFNTFDKMYHSGVTSVMDYCAGVWGFKKIEACDKIQLRALRYYLGVHAKTPILAIEGDTG